MPTINCAQSSKEIQDLFNFVNAIDINELSKSCGFIKRFRKLSPRALIMAIIAMFLGRNVSDGQVNGFDICDIASNYNLFVDRFPIIS